ncbi:MAG: hypothetical protein R2828_17300 [Saprospiraceae bacterium]
MKKTLLALLVLLPILAFGQTKVAFADYLSLRDSIMGLDSTLYFDREVDLNPKEAHLNRVLAAEQKTLLDHYKATHFFPPARNFYQSKAHIEATKIFEVIRKMPKGGVLHLHQLAMSDADWVVDRALQIPEMHIYWGSPHPSFIKGQFHAYPIGDAPSGFFPVQEMERQYPAFADSIRQLITFEEWIDRDSVDIWLHFEAVFQRIYRFVTYQTVFPDYLERGLALLAADHIQHVELRTPFTNWLYDLDHPQGGLPIDEFVQILDTTLQRIRRIDPHFTFKIIHTNLRFRDNSTIWADIQYTMGMRKRFPEWLKGYDLVAEEDNGQPTLFHANTFLRMDSLEEAMGITLPLYLHDGESDWASVANLYDAVLLGTQRIGHGFNLFRFPNLMEEVKKRAICVEINPLSNQILGYLRDLRIHPGSTYLRRGLDCVISSDDPLIFDYQGLSYDFWSVYMAWELDLAALKQLSKNSLLHAVLSDEEKAKALSVWEERWQQFVEEALALLENKGN